MPRGVWERTAQHRQAMSEVARRTAYERKPWHRVLAVENGRKGMASRWGGLLDRQRRFWMRVRIDDSGCWVWQGPVTANGYGRFNHDRVHRLAWQWLIGPIPEGLTLDHLCRTKLCVNPTHLEPVTVAENVRRGRREAGTQ